MRLPRTEGIRLGFVSRSLGRDRRADASRSYAPGVRASAIVPAGLCEMACNSLPEPARSICKAAC